MFMGIVRECGIPQQWRACDATSFSFGVVYVYNNIGQRFLFKGGETNVDIATGESNDFAGAITIHQVGSKIMTMTLMTLQHLTI
jgi:hypothetical protein